MNPFVKSITESELAYVASLDYGEDSLKHLEALRAVIFEQEGNLKAEQYWHPYEVIELGALSLEPGHEREFVICTLLVIQAVVSGYDKSTDLAERRMDKASYYAALPVGLGEKISNAYQAAGAN